MMRYLIWWLWLPLHGFAQKDWTNYLQPSLDNNFYHSTINPFSQVNANAVLAFTDSGAYGIAFENNFAIKEHSKLHLSLKLKTKNGGWGLHGYAWGSELFNVMEIGTAYGIRLNESFGIGTRISVKRDQLRGFSPLYIILPQLGLLYFISKKLSIGVHIRKSINSYISDKSMHSQLNQLSTGMGYQLNEKFYLCAEIIHRPNISPTVITYTAYAPRNDIWTCISYNSMNNEIQVGFYYRMNKINLGIGVSNHSYLGNSSYMMMYHGF